MEPILNKREERHAAQLQTAGVPIAPAWFEGNALFTMFLNASSVAIPEAERLVISTVQELAATVSLPEYAHEIQNIIHEEVAHSNVHDAYNGYLRRTGLDINAHEEKVKAIGLFLKTHFSLKTRLAMCAITEHFTATMAKQVLDTGIFEGRGVDERMDRVWTWHALEELDHRSTVYDLYMAVGGGYWRRFFAAAVMTGIFLYTQFSCFFSLLNQKGLLFSFKVWREGLPMLLGKRGVYKHLTTNWLLFFKPGFHPTSIPIANNFKKQLHHYHIESELVAYFKTTPIQVA